MQEAGGHSKFREGICKANVGQPPGISWKLRKHLLTLYYSSTARNFVLLRPDDLFSYEHYEHRDTTTMIPGSDADCDLLARLNALKRSNIDLDNKM